MASDKNWGALILRALTSDALTPPWHHIPAGKSQNITAPAVICGSYDFFWLILAVTVSPTRPGAEHQRGWHLGTKGRGDSTARAPGAAWSQGGGKLKEMFLG